jgi:phosphatidylserine/phosphatidylglycerophosphate/cardiolipin synthase-like enzyme
VSIHNDDNKVSMTQWWAKGDTPVRRQSRVTYFVDGQSVLLEMCLHFFKAKQTIYLANWGMEPDMLIVRGNDHKPDTTDPEAYAAFIAALHAEGLQAEDIDFWLNHDLSLKGVLGYVVRKGIEVKVLLWKVQKAFAVYDPQAAYEKLTAVGVTCLLDDSAEGILHHPIESLHQKVTIVDHAYAFIGGVDPLIEKEHDFDRWDTSVHAFSNPLRKTQDDTISHPWHDAHALVEGLASDDVELNFRQRWNDLVTHHHLEEKLYVPEHPMPAPVESESIVQIARTVPKHTYSFDKEAILGITQLYDSALRQAQRVIYLENQYLWVRANYGIDIPLLGNDSPEMEKHVRQIIEAIHRGVTISIILPDHPNVGRAFSDAVITRIRTELPQETQAGRVQAFTLATSQYQPNDGQSHYRPIYVHAKVAIVDDIWTTVGSGNLNNRGMHDDTEINVATLDKTLAYGLRLLLQAEHLGLLSANELHIAARLYRKQRLTAEETQRATEAQHKLETQLHDPFQAVQLMQKAANENLQRYKAHQPLIGHLLPYLTAEEALEQGLPFQQEHGWIEEPNNN